MSNSFQSLFHRTPNQSLDSSQSSSSTLSSSPEIQSAEEDDGDWVIIEADEDSPYSSDSQYPLSPASSSSTSPRRASRRTPLMSRREWLDATLSACGNLRSDSPITFRVVLSDFTIENGTRYEIKRSSLHFFKKYFPQFHAQSTDPKESLRFRQTLSSPNGPTIHDIIEAANFFLERIGKYSEDEIRFLINYYNEMGVSVFPSTCLTTILAVHIAFNKEFRFRSFSQTITMHGRAISNLNQRVTTLEQEQEQNRERQEAEQEEPLKGKDRACYLKIRPCDMATREKWCVPGGVFGLYSDGVGKLLPLKSGTYRRSVYVYSVDPDRLEAHPDPEHPELYVAVVMVGEAPINLRPDQYEKLLRHCGHFDIYVNHMGDVCIRKFERSPPSGGTVIAITSWEKGYPTDPQGYPLFQETRGVRAKIYGPPLEPNIPTIASVKALAREAAWKVTRSLKNDYLLPAAGTAEATATAQKLMEERLAMFGELAELKKRQSSEDPQLLKQHEEERRGIKVPIHKMTREIKAML